MIILPPVLSFVVNQESFAADDNSSSIMKSELSPEGDNSSNFIMNHESFVGQVYSTDNREGPILFLNPINNVVSGGPFTVSGLLLDEKGNGINGEEIKFQGDGFVLPNVITSGITFDSSGTSKEIEIAVCQCGSDDEFQRNLDPDADNKYLRLYEGGRIEFPEKTRGATLVLQDIGTSQVRVTVTNDEDGSFTTTGDRQTFFAQSEGMAPNFAVFRVSPIGSFVKEIQVDAVDNGDYMGISSMTTIDFGGSPQVQHVIDFEEFDVGPKGTVFFVNDGFFFSTGRALADEEGTVRKVKAQLVVPALSAQLDEVTTISSEEREYTVTVATATDLGSGGESSTIYDYTGSDYSTSPSCAQDSDSDGLCNDWETTGVTFTKGDGTQGTLSLCFTDAYADAWNVPPWNIPPPSQPICPRVDHKDVFVEIDFQEDHQLSSDAIKDVIRAFGQGFGNPTITNAGPDAFGRTAGITLHVVQSEQIIDHQLEYVYAWKDPTTAAGEPHDENNFNDFAFLKKEKFGTGAGPFGIDNIPDNQRNAAVNGVGPVSSDVTSNNTLGGSDNTVQFRVHDSDSGLSNLTITTFDSVKGTLVITTTVVFSADPDGTGTVTGAVTVTGDPALNISNPTASVVATASKARQVTIKIPFATATAATDKALTNITVTLTSSSSPSSTVSVSSLKSPEPVVTTEILDKLAWVYRYGMSVHSYNNSCSPSGLGEVAGNDFIVSLGCNFDELNNPASHPDPNPADLNKYSVGSREEQAGTLMHELGHTLGLYHGAPKKVGGTSTPSSDYNANCKPNYPSVMTYARQFPTYWGFTGADKQMWREQGLDYSRQIVTPQLKEGTSPYLDENVGLSIDTTNIYTQGQTVVWGSPDGTLKIAKGAASPSSKDWEYNGNLQTGVLENVNNLNISGCTGYGSTLNGFNDWSNLLYSSFRTDAASYDGVYASPLALPQEISPKIHKQMQIQALIFLPKVIPPWIWVLIAIIILGIILAVVLIRQYGLMWWTWLIIAIIILAIIVVVWVLILTFS